MQIRLGARESTALINYIHKLECIAGEKKLPPLSDSAESALLVLYTIKRTKQKVLVVT